MRDLYAGATCELPHQFALRKRDLRGANVHLLLLHRHFDDPAGEGVIVLLAVLGDG